VTLHIYSTHEKLAEIERLIVISRKSAVSEEDYRRIAIVRSIAADLRARMDCAPSVALHEIERRVVFAKRSVTRLGFDNGALVGIAQEIIGRWPLIKQCLEKFGATAEDNCT
jgi:hypothetical protein